VNAATGIYTYTPSSSERSVGGLDRFTVTATDGHDTSTFVVTVPVRAPELASSQTQIPLPGSGPNIALSGSRAYVFNKYLWTVSSIDTNTNTVIRTSQPLASGSTLSYPGNVAVSPDGTRVYVANWVEGKIIQLDPNTLAPVGQPIAVAGGGDDMVFSPDGTRLYVANDGAPGSLTVIDTNSRSVVGTIPTTYDTTDMAMSSDGRTLYLADGYYNRIQVLDTNTKSVVGYIPLGSQSYNGNPGGIALSPDGRWAYVTDPDNATVSVIDLTSRTVVGDPIVVGVPRWEASTVSWPTAIAVSADGTRVYVANGDDIVVIDAATRKVVGAVRFPGYVSDSSARATQTLAVDSNGDLLIYGGNGLTSVSLGASGSQMT
jgi:YVTN family beta-propeller protein